MCSKVSALAQYGGDVGGNTQYRIYTKYFNQDQMPSLTGQNGGDGWHMLRTGFRTDSALSAKDALTVEGNLYSGREGELGYRAALDHVSEPSGPAGGD